MPSARRLAGRTLAIVEIGTAGQLGALLGKAEWLVFGELLAAGSAMAAEHRGAEDYAARVREVAPSDVGLAVRVRERGGDTAVTIAVGSTGSVTQVDADRVPGWRVGTSPRGPPGLRRALDAPRSCRKG